MEMLNNTIVPVQAFSKNIFFVEMFSRTVRAWRGQKVYLDFNIYESYKSKNGLQYFFLLSILNLRLTYQNNRIKYRSKG